MCPKDTHSFCVFNTKKDRKDQERYILKNGGRPALELHTSITNALLRSRIGIFMNIRFKAGKTWKFYCILLSYFRKQTALTKAARTKLTFSRYRFRTCRILPPKNKKISNPKSWRTSTWKVSEKWKRVVINYTWGHWNSDLSGGLINSR